jgi:DNA-directed RNA polymerase subunit omega
MLHPSYADLMNVVNKDVTEDETPIVTSRYSMVMASAKRARQIVSGDETFAGSEDEKPLSIAIDEINEGKVTILPNTED